MNIKDIEAPSESEKRYLSGMTPKQMVEVLLCICSGCRGRSSKKFVLDILLKNAGHGNVVKLD